MKFWERTDNFPPILCRLMAQHKKQPLSTEQIARRSGLPAAVVETLSDLTEWNAVSVEHLRKFTYGCHMDFTSRADIRRAEDFIRKNPQFVQLRSSKHWKDYYLPKLMKWRRSYGPVEQRKDIWPPLKQLMIRLNPLLTTPKQDKTSGEQ